MATARIDPKRRADLISHKKKQFAEAPAKWKQQEYKWRLSFYDLPPTEEVSLEEFELWALGRLKVLAELESCTFRNRTPEETASYMAPIMEKHLPLHSNSSRSSELDEERKRDHYSHFILRLAFAGTKDLRQRFSRLETMLFKLRWKDDDAVERKEFLDSLDMQLEKAGESELNECGVSLEQAKAATGWRKGDAEAWFTLDWERVPDLVESRRCLLRRGKAYVLLKEQMSFVVAEFTKRLDAALEITSRALPRLDEDDRLSPILSHLSKSFTAPDASFDAEAGINGLQAPTAGTVDALSSHFPLCMQNMHRTLRQDAKLKHQGRLEYTLFLKGIGLDLSNAVEFWRRSFRTITDEKFTKEYLYNVKHAYGEVGGDANRRGRGYTPFSCQKLLTEPLPGPGQTHGCPYRTHTDVENLVALLGATGMRDPETIKSVREDVGKQRYHIACNRVFEFAHKSELERVKRKGGWGPAELDTILHPNSYFKRSFLLKHLGEGNAGFVEPRGEDVKMEGSLDE